ncbi:transglycosylase domain-containing protein [Caldifermentibacillus hisashii]|uniref:transglycosylase domain-containing protein n=1 Tax=Caldifermentibacillus hisashii TaxID=996558 RepID=UPI0034D4FD51
MELKTNPYFRKTVKYIHLLLLISACSVIIGFFAIFTTYMIAKLSGPPPIEIPQSTIYYAEDGTVIGELHNGQKRYWVNLDDISPDLINATLAIEDQRFYSHIGFDPKRIAGALIADLKAMAKVQGASTISQQYARNLFLSHEKTLARKIKEAFYTIRLEANYSKKEILEGYLNTIYYGHGTYGIEAASRYYFYKNAKDLNLQEAALLAGIPKGPNSFSPFISYEKAKARQELILSEMAKQGFISKAEAEKAKSANIDFIGNLGDKQGTTAPYFQDVVNNQLKSKIGLDERTIELGGLKVFTTLDSKLQQVVEEQVKKTIPENSLIQTAVVVMEPKTGYVQALIGGRDYQESSFNRATQAMRQPGSTIKPILYYAALERGFTPVSMFRSELTTFTFDDGREKYTPENFNHKYADDDITLMQALALSDNVYAVKTHLFLGMETLVETAKKFGIQSDLEKVPSLALGTSNVRLIEMANAYSLLANGGKSVEPVFITKVVDSKGKVIYEQKKEAVQVLDPDITFVMNHMLTGIFDEKLNGYTNVTGQSILSKTTKTYAGKSGSTNMDSWMIGFTPKLVTAVWTGYDQGKSINRTDERQFAKNIWVNIMENALEGKPDQLFKPTPGVIGVNINPETGLLATKDCPVKRYTYFIKGTEPTEYCSEPEANSPDDEQPLTKDPEKSPWYRKWFKWID